MRILAVGAHPDDMEISCAGTLAKYASQGHTIGMAIMTNGGMGSNHVSKKEIVSIRETEARASAGVIGAELFWIGCEDGLLEYDVASRMRLIRVIREFSPELIITQNPDDYNADHRITSKHVLDAGLMAHVGPLMEAPEPLEHVPAIAFMDPLGGLNFVPERFVDISEHIETKLKMLQCHKSQQAWMKEYGDVDYVEMVEVGARYRGIQSGVKYAEGFRIWHGWQTTKCEPVMP